MIKLEFANPLAIWAFITLVPIIILYLIKPKPKDVKIPSLMFILEIQKKQDKISSLLRRFVKDPLLLIQLFVLSLLAIAMINPFYFTTKTLESENIALILDASASMQSTDTIPSRFTRAIELAKNVISDKDKVSIILAESIPIVALREGSGKDAKNVLDNLNPKATTTNLGDAIILAKDVTSGPGRRIIVLSDFSNSVSDPLLAEKLAKAEDIRVDLVNVCSEGENIGIVGLKPLKEGYLITVKNYMNKRVSAIIEVLRDGTLITSEQRIIQPLSDELFVLRNISPGVTTINLKPDDDFSVDNKALIVIPAPKKYRALIITENRTFTSYLKFALLASESVELSEAIPPVVPAFDSYDVVILDKFKKDSLLPGTIHNLIKYVENGGSLIVIASDYLKTFNELRPALPIKINESFGKSKVKIETINEITRDIYFEGIFTKYLLVGRKNGSIVLATAQNDNTPVMAYWDLGKGKVAYIGIRPEDTWSDFHLKPSFPIFWLKLIEGMRESGAIKAYNFKTGDLLPLQKETNVKTPSTAFKTENLYLDEVGIYEIEGAKIATNLLDEKESDISHTSLPAIRNTSSRIERIIRDVKKDFNFYLLPLALGLVIWELLYLKNRGEL